MNTKYAKALNILSEIFKDDECIYMPNGDRLTWDGTEWVKTGTHNVTTYRGTVGLIAANVQVIINALISENEDTNSLADCLNNHADCINKHHNKINEIKNALNTLDRQSCKKSPVGRTWWS